MKTKGTLVLIAALSAGFLFGLWKLYELRFEAGDVYPAYSSLRSDPLGSKAIFESIGQLEDVSAARNYQPIEKLPKGKTTVFLLGMDPFQFEDAKEEKLKDLEALAQGGDRVVIAMRPVPRIDPSKDDKKPDHQPQIETRWGVSFGYLVRPKDVEDESSGITKVTALYFRYEGKTVHEVERKFGAGVIVLLANSYPFSNEALAGERDAELIAKAMGDNHQVIFDESHLGLTEDAGVATLARKYRLQGVVAALLVLLALFIWRNSTSFLPARVDKTTGDEGIEAKDAGSGLANLLRRNVPAKELMKTCLQQWETSQHGGRYYPVSKIERAQNWGKVDADAGEAYREIAKILRERNRG